PQSPTPLQSRPMPPLDGIRVVDLTRVVAGPFCTMMLGDMGAEVLKIEEPTHGDDTRGWGPFINGTGSFYFALNRSKKSVARDLRDGSARRHRAVRLDALGDAASARGAHRDRTGSDARGQRSPDDRAVRAAAREGRSADRRGREPAVVGSVLRGHRTARAPR